MPANPRNYKQEYARYQGTPEQIARRSSRNKARRAAVRAGLMSKNSDKDVNHRNGNPMDNSTRNLQPLGAGSNRSYPRTSKAKKKNPKD